VTAGTEARVAASGDGTVETVPRQKAGNF